MRERVRQRRPPRKHPDRHGPGRGARIAALGSMALALPLVLSAATSRIEAMPTAAVAVDGKRFAVRLAATPALRAAGFQYVPAERMARTAIFFAYREPARPGFHMRNVARPLLIAWVAPDCRVLAVDRMTPGSEGHAPPAPVSGALEYTAGHPLAASVRPGRCVRLQRQ